MTLRLERLNPGRNMALVAFALIATGGPVALAAMRVTPPNAIEARGSSAASQSPDEPDWQKAAGGKMSFEVASIRPSKPGTFTPPNFPLSNDDAYEPTGGVFTADFPLEVYLEFAYKFRPSPDQRKAIFEHLPKWVTTDHFTIHARAAGNPTKDQMRLMVQSLLADRFKLAIHFETKQVPALAMTLIKPGKLGPKLIPHAQGPPCDPSATLQTPGANSSHVFPPICDAQMLERTPNHMIETGSRNATLEIMAAAFSSLGRLDRPVIDRTGLSGRFDFTLEWTMESSGPEAAASAATPADEQTTTFLQALKEQLGVKLEPTVAPISILVVDHVEQPSEN